ncbi:MAG: flagellar biosynthetic protein FliO [Panacagrimonas sp.]
MLQMALSLAAVVAMILGLAWLTRRMQGLRGTQTSELRIKATLAVGLKERVVILEAAGQQFLIGVAPGQVSILKALGPADAVSKADVFKNDSAAPPSLGESFAHQLKQLLGR